jgi:phosphoribosylglycinamide formyltransferase 1
VTAAPEAAPAPPLAAAVLASGGGTNFQALLEHAHAPGTPWRVALLITDRPDAGVLGRADRAGVPSRVIQVTGREGDAAAEEMLEAFQDSGVRMLLLAGYLRLVPAPVVRSYRDRILNVHPALLPAFGGKGMYGHRVHDAVLAAGVLVTGVTVHLVDEEYDRGRILAQWPVPVLPGDDAALLAARVQAAEHRLYPRVADHVVRAVQEGREPGSMDLGPWLLPALDRASRFSDPTNCES